MVHSYFTVIRAESDRNGINADVVPIMKVSDIEETTKSYCTEPRMYMPVCREYCTKSWNYSVLSKME